MILAAPGPLLTPPPSSSPPKTPHQGHLIKLKATGESAYSLPTEEAGLMWHRKDEGEESEEEESEGEESEGEESEGEESEGEDVGAAMAAVKLE